MQDIKEILDWYILAGVDEICTSDTCNLLKTETASASANDSKQTATMESKVLYQSSDIRPATTLLAQETAEACRNARDLCAKVKSLEELRQVIENFTGCSLKFSANSTVFGYGNPQAKIMFIGEAPGNDEDRIGKPFVGRSGQLLDKMLAAIKLCRQDCFISNILPWRPPGNRTPTDGEIAVCLPFLQKQIDLIKPKILYLLGASAANALLDNNESISVLRGKSLEYTTFDGNKIQTFASYHPAYLLRTPSQKAKAWSDLLRLRRKIDEL